MSIEPEVELLRSFDAEASHYLREMLFNDDKGKRAKWFKMFEDPIFHHKFNLTLD